MDSSKFPKTLGTANAINNDAVHISGVPENVHNIATYSSHDSETQQKQKSHKDRNVSDTDTFDESNVSLVIEMPENLAYILESNIEQINAILKQKPCDVQCALSCDDQKVSLLMNGPKERAEEVEQYFKTYIDQVIVHTESIPSNGNDLQSVLEQFSHRLCTEIYDVRSSLTVVVNGQEYSLADIDASVPSLLTRVNSSSESNIYLLHFAAHRKNRKLLDEAIKRVKNFMKDITIKPLIAHLTPEITMFLQQLDCVIFYRNERLTIAGPVHNVDKLIFSLQQESKPTTAIITARNIVYSEYIRNIRGGVLLENIIAVSSQSFTDLNIVPLRTGNSVRADAVMMMIGSPSSVNQARMSAEREITQIQNGLVSETVSVKSVEVLNLFFDDEKLLEDQELQYHVYAMKAEIVPLKLENTEDDASLTASFDSAVNQPPLIYVKQANFTDIHVDVLVNAANGQLYHAGGIARAISVEAGSQFQLESIQSVRKHGKIPAGGARFTSAGLLTAKQRVRFVAHAVAPIYSDQARWGIHYAILNVLKLCNDQPDVKSVGIPLIGSGIFGWKANLAAEEVVSAIQFAFTRGYLAHITKIVLFDFDRSKIDAFVQAVQSSAKNTTNLEKIPSLYIKPDTFSPILPTMNFTHNSSSNMSPGILLCGSTAGVSRAQPIVSEHVVKLQSDLDAKEQERLIHGVEPRIELNKTSKTEQGMVLDKQFSTNKGFAKTSLHEDILESEPSKLVKVDEDMTDENVVDEDMSDDSTKQIEFNTESDGLHVSIKKVTVNLQFVPRDCPEFHHIETLLSIEDTSYQISKIERVENQQLKKKYIQDKADFSILPAADEKCLLYGDRRCNPEEIIQLGFSFSGHHIKFGKGIYFFESVDYVASQAFSTKNGEKIFIIARVRTGAVEDRGIDRGIRKPSKGYDSVRGKITKNHNTVVVYNASQAYPEYIVTLTKS
eukprot:gene10462-2592_t